MRRVIFLSVCGFLVSLGVFGAPAALTQQRETAPADPVRQLIDVLVESLHFTEESLNRTIDEAALFRRVDDLAITDKVRYTGPPPRVIKNPTARGAGNPVILSAYTFLPRKYLPGGKLPLVILVHGGIHGNFDSSHIHILRELLQQGYAVLAPEYRGSSGYGKDFWQLIDYGGLEVEDVFAGRQWMLENQEGLDPSASASWVGATAGSSR